MRGQQWFRASRLGGVPVHWTPVAWQGWVVVALLIGGMLGALGLWGTTAPGRFVGVICGLVVVTFTVAALTDGE